jgi:hypothetical protein
MNGEYLRVTPAELDRALKDPDWALDLAEAIQDAQEEQESAPRETRHFTTHKTWDLLGFLLRRSAFPVDIVHGEELLAADDWGYGPPQYLTPDRVRLAADTLQQTTYGQLIEGVDPSELAEARLPPNLGLAHVTGVGPGSADSPDRVLPRCRIRRARDADLARLSNLRRSDVEQPAQRLGGARVTWPVHVAISAFETPSSNNSTARTRRASANCGRDKRGREEPSTEEEG